MPEDSSLELAGGFTRTAKTDHTIVIRKDAQGHQHAKCSST